MSKLKFSKNDATFRGLLKQIRLSAKLTQTDVARRLGQPQSYVSKYETGERRLDFVETAMVCEAIGIGLESFAAAYTSKTAKSRRAKG